MAVKKRKDNWQTIDSSAKWHDFLTKNSPFEANFTQSFNWGLFHERLNQKIFRRGLINDKEHIIAGYTAILEVGKYYRFLTITGAPLINWQNLKQIESLKADLRQLGQKNNCHFVRIRPQDQDSLKMRSILKSLNFKVAPNYLSVEFAGLIDLSLSEEQLFNNMSQSLRRKIRKAQKDEQIEIKVSNSKEDALLFAKIHQEHAKMQKYVPFSEKRLVCQFETFAKDNQAKLYLAYKKTELLAANMIFFYNLEASYHYGVSTLAGQKYSAAPLLHLKAIAEAKERGLKFYNLWGIVETHQTKHRFFGLSQFKRSFGLIEYKYTPAHDLVIKPFAYIFIRIFEKLRRRYRRV